jgi:hypothetical protein
MDLLPLKSRVRNTLPPSPGREYRVHRFSTHWGLYMKPTAILPLAIVLIAAGAAAQTLSPRTLWQEPLSQDATACPVGLEANHGSSYLARKTINGRDSDPGMTGQEPGQRIRLKMTNQRLQDIASLEITVHGLSNRWRTIPLSTAPYKADLFKKLHLVLAVKPNANASSDLALNRFTTVTAIDLDAVTYADGSVWRASSPHSCTVVPSALMLASGSQ